MRSVHGQGVARSMKRLAYAVTLLLAVVVTTTWQPTEARASVSVEVSLSDLSQKAAMVVVGRPVESKARWEDIEGVGKRIVTYHRVAVDQVVAGSSGGQDLWVRCLGGQVGNIGQKVEGEAAMIPGQRVLLFLHKRSDGSASVVGMAQGLYRIERASDGTDRLRVGTNRGRVFPSKGKKGASTELAGLALSDAVSKIAAARAAQGKP